MGHSLELIELNSDHVRRSLDDLGLEGNKENSSSNPNKTGKENITKCLFS